MKSSSDIGRLGESDAEGFLETKGLKILERNYRTAMGEIDLIAVQGDTIVFVEVRTRSRDGLVHGIETITPAKQRRIVKSALVYMNKPAMKDHSMRFDVIVLEAGQIEWVRDAFSGAGSYWR